MERVMKNILKCFISVFCLITLLFTSCKFSVGKKKTSDSLTYTITYIVHRGTAPQAITVDADTVLSENQLPVVHNDNYNFSGWYDGNKRVEAGKYKVIKDVTLAARWDFDEPLTFEVIYGDADHDLIITNPWTTLKYSKNGGELIPAGTHIPVELGDRLCFYAEGSENTQVSSSKMRFGGAAVCNIYGNFMSLVTYNSSTGEWNPDATSVTEYAFAGLFDCSYIYNHDTKDLYLPAVTLANSCYAGMFFCCYGINRAPALPATTLAEYCYSSMFVASNVIQGPDLLAPTLVKGCYDTMFMSCPYLNYVKCLATDITAGGTSCWLGGSGFSASGTFIKAPDMENWSRDENGIPSGWTVRDAE